MPRSFRMTALAARLTTIVAVLATLSMVGGSASAAGGVDRQAWSHTGSLPETVPYQSGRLYVAATAGEEQARTFLHVDTAGPANHALTAAVLRLAEDPADSALGQGALLSACALRAPVPATGRFDGPSPDLDCTLRTELSRDANGVWSIELKAFAEQWVTASNHGLAVIPSSDDPGTTFRLSFDIGRTSLAGLTGAPIQHPRPTPSLEEPVSTALPVPPPVAPPLLAPQVGSPPTSAVTTAAPQPVTPEPVGSPEAEFVPVGSPVDGRATVVAFAMLASLALGVLLLLRRRGHVVTVPPRLRRAGGIPAAVTAGVAVLSLLPLTFSEVNAYKAGLVLVFLVGALGLHVLVNWAGQLSLAHAGMVGLPAFVVISISGTHDVSPLYLLPLGMVVGALLGAVVSLPTIRAKGLQVTLVTFAAGIAIDRYFFTQTWLVGESGDRVSAVPSLGPWTFETSRELYPVVLCVVALVVLALWAVMQSRLARAWFWIQEDEPAAATYGVPVATYKILAYVLAGVLAGLSGGLTAVWVQQLSSSAFPASTLSFTYLLVVVLAGRGFVGGVVAAVLLIEGGRLFLAEAFGGDVDLVIEYVGPVALILNLILYKGGFNRAGRQLMDTLRQHLPPIEQTDRREPLSLSLVTGTVAIAAGLVAIAAAWYQAGNTDELWIQNQELLSGGIGGLSLVIVGVGLLIRDRLSQQPAALARALADVLAANAHGSEPAHDLVADAAPRARVRRRAG